MDLMKDAKILIPAYSDPGLVTEKFILNTLIRINKDLGANLDISNFKLDVELKHSTQEDVGRIEIYVKSLKAQKLNSYF